MNTRTQIIIDKWFVQLIAVAMNLMARIFGKLLNINHNLNRSFETIAVCKFKGMGSIIQSTPLLSAIKEKYPNAELIYISTSQNKALIEKIAAIDSYILLNDKSVASALKSFFPFIVKLIRKRIQLYFDLEIYSNISSIIALVSFSTNRIGYYLRSANYRMGIYTHMVYFNTRLPIYQVYLQLGRVVNIEERNYELYNFRSSVTNISLEGLDIIGKKYIVINPNASDLRIERRWDASNFAKLIDACIEKYRFISIVLVGSKSERHYVKKLVEKVKHTKNIIDLSGRTNMEQLISVIGHAQLMITNDTGPMHLGFSMKIPVICLFGPCLPGQYGNFANTITIYKNVYCSPCVHEFVVPPCKGNNTCMKLITVYEVLEAVDTTLTEKSVLDNQQQPASINFYNDSEALGIVNRTTK